MSYDIIQSFTRNKCKKVLKREPSASFSPLFGFVKLHIVYQLISDLFLSGDEIHKQKLSFQHKFPSSVLLCFVQCNVKSI